MLDFTNCKKLVNSYEGADIKLKVELDGDIYMLKFGQKLEPNDKNPLQASYASTPVSEYLSSHIYELAGIPTQHTVLGTYYGKVVVACQDFIEGRPDANDVTLIEFKKLENSFLGSSTAGGRTPLLDNLLEVFSEHESLDGIRDVAEDRYWKMFAVDALIGNFDRHAGNWGYILDKRKNAVIELAPVYDCGSSFYPQLNETAMRAFIKDRNSLEARVMQFPRAALRMESKKVLYHEFLLSPEGSKAREALGELLPKIDFEKIHQLIKDIPCISDIRREFYSQLVDIRREIILEPAYALYREEKHLSVDLKSPTADVSLKAEVKAAREASKALEIESGKSAPIPNIER